MAKGLDVLYQTDGIFEELWGLIEGYVVPIWFRDFPVLERESADMRIFESQVVTGLLQTEDYARAVLTAAGRTGALDERVVLWIEGTTGGLAIDARDKVEDAAVRFDLIRDNALAVEDSVALIGKAREQL